MLFQNKLCTTEKKIIKMTDSMKFGPEWLRNLSAEGNSTLSSSGGTRYQLSEHRYGREEMLALFEQSLKLRPPASMMGFPTLYVDQALNPLALAPVTEDENRLWTRGSVAVGGNVRGRGGSMDRGSGRGRGRGGSYHPSFNRSSSTYDEPVRSYDRSQSDRGSWQERNGDISTDWGGSSSPRKEYIGGGSRGSSSGGSSENWRRHNRETEEAGGGISGGVATSGGDGWRGGQSRGGGHQEKWARSSSGNWREGGDSEIGERQPSANRLGGHWHASNSEQSSRAPPHRRPWDAEDHLPEWAMENPTETGGTFDSSGKFHNSDDESESTRGPTRKEPQLQKSQSQHTITVGKNVIQSPKRQPLQQSQSAVNLNKKPPEVIDSFIKEKNDRTAEKDDSSDSRGSTIEPIDKKEPELQKEVHKAPKLEKKTDKIEEKQIELGKKEEVQTHRIEDEFDHMKEVTIDLVSKLITDDDTFKMAMSERGSSRGGRSSGAPNLSFVGSQVPTGLGPSPATIPPPTNTNLPGMEKWFYRDPQGEVQGPFSCTEMSEWYRAGYFSVSLLLRRQCDDRYCTLGDLVKQCGGMPFINCRLPPLKVEVPPPPQTQAKLPVAEPPTSSADQLLQQQIQMQRYLQRQTELLRTLSLTPENQGSIPGQNVMDVPPPAFGNQNPLLNMINQMSQTKIKNEKLDSLQQLVQQMGLIGAPNLGVSQNINPLGGQVLPPKLGPLAASPNLAANLLGSSVNPLLGNQVLGVNQALGSNVPPNLASQLGGQVPLGPQGAPQINLNHGPQPQMNLEGQTDEAIKNFFRQLAGKTQGVDSMWASNVSQASFVGPQVSSGVAPTNQWLGMNQAQSQVQVPLKAPVGMPTSLWDLHGPTPAVPPPVPIPTSIQQQQEKEKEQNAIKEKEQQQRKEQQESASKEQKAKQQAEQAEKERKRKEQQQIQQQLEQERLKKENEEKARREAQAAEQKKREATEKERKKEEERIRRELEKARKEAEEKRQRELEEKRRLKEQRKREQEEAAKKKQQQEEEEELRRRIEMQEKQEQALKRQAEALRKMQESQQQQQRSSKVAPWGNQNVIQSQIQTQPHTLSLAEIQRIEREKKAQEQALLQQQQRIIQQQKEIQEQQIADERQNSLQLGWAKKVLAPKKVKSLAEIQAEEQEKLQRQLAEQRAAQLSKDRESIHTSVSVGIWGTASHSLHWNNNGNSNNQWQGNNQQTGGGFWDEAPQVQKIQQNQQLIHQQQIAAQSKLQQNVANAINKQQIVSLQKNKNLLANNKSKTRKDEAHVMKLFDKNAGNQQDEFTAWCTKTLQTLNSEVDIPTFVGFLRDIESPYEVKDYVRQYLGENPQAAQFANQFVERRSRARDKQRAALQHKDDLNTPAPANPNNSEFTEVKTGKGKKSKKKNMVKLDNTALGFNVIAAQDRINVGDRDYGDGV